jgi:hypothetical protein
MTYENYLFVSWTDGTPLTGTRLAQMSTNIEQVKDVIDDKATGVIKMDQTISSVGSPNGYFVDYAEHEIVYLNDSSAMSGSDRRVSIAANRYYRTVVNIPSIALKNYGGEDCKYTVNVYQGANIADTNKLLLASWDVTPAPYLKTDYTTGAISLKTTSYPSKFGGSTYSVLKSTSTALVNQNFFASVTRTAGSDAAALTGWRVDASAASPIQLYVEDVGGV